MERLALVEDDDEGTIYHVPNVGNNGVDADLCLVGRFLADKAVRVHVMKERLAGIWRPGKGVTIREVEPGLFIFQFYHKVDLQRIFNGGPWSFDNYMLVLGRLHAGQRPSQVDLNHLCIWVQIHDLPAGFMTQDIGQHLGNFIGEFLEYDPNNNAGFWRSYMRIRVRVDVRKPLRKERKVKRVGGEWSMVQFKYERLGVFCYLCGVIGHTEQYCDQLFEMQQDDGVRFWGPSLKAEAKRGGGAGGSRWLRETPAGGGPRAGVTVNQNPINGIDNEGINGNGNHLAVSQSMPNNGANLLATNDCNQIIPRNGGATLNVDATISRAIQRVQSPVLTYIGPIGEPNNESPAEKKRRHAMQSHGATSSDFVMEDVSQAQSNDTQHFLLAGPGAQACQEP